MIEIIILGIFSAILLTCILLNISIIFALLLGLVLFFIYGLSKKHTVLNLVKYSLSGILTIKNILITFILIGIITAIWRCSGTIPFIVYYATKAFTPKLMVVITFWLCCLMSMLTGTAFGTVATVGVICITLSNSMGIPLFYTGGAVLSGVFFGDRCSPMSTSALLISELTKTDIFKNISNMMKTSIVPFILASAIYFLMGLFSPVINESSNIQSIFADYFNLNVVTFIPAAIIIILSIFKVNVKKAMSFSILAGAIITVLFQNTSFDELIKIMVMGYHPENSDIASLLSGGGIISMVNVFIIVCISSCYSGIFKATGFLEFIKTYISNISEKITPFGSILFTSIITGFISCNQTLNIMLTYQLCKDVEEDPETLACHLENSAVVISPLIPWSIACTVVLGAISAPNYCILTACYLYILPIWNLLINIHKHSPSVNEGYISIK